MKSALIATLLVAAAVRVFAADSYSFVVNLVDHHFAFTDPKGTHWTILQYGCGTKHPNCEVHLNTRGAAASLPGETAKAEHGPFDVAIQQIDEQTARLRCLRDECALTIGDKDVHLYKNATTDVASGTRVTLR